MLGTAICRELQYEQREHDHCAESMKHNHHVFVYDGAVGKEEACANVLENDSLETEPIDRSSVAVKHQLWDVL